MSRNALVSHPTIGSLWLRDAEVLTNAGGEKWVKGWIYTGDHPPYPEKDIMSFPLSCVRKWEQPQLLHGALGQED